MMTKEQYIDYLERKLDQTGETYRKRYHFDIDRPESIELRFEHEEYAKFYSEYSYEKLNETDMLTGNINRMCVCETEDELYKQYFYATKRLQNLLRLRLSDFSEREKYIPEVNDEAKQ